MSFFDESDIAPIGPEKTVCFRWPVRVRGCAEPVEMECRWRFNPSMIEAMQELAFQQLDDKARELGEIERLARHVVVGWRNVPARDGGDEPYNADGCAELLRRMRYALTPTSKAGPDGGEDNALVSYWMEFRALISDAKNFGAPLVDPAALGKR